MRTKPDKFESGTPKANVRRGGPRYREKRSPAKAAGGDGVASPALEDAPAPQKRRRLLVDTWGFLEP